MSVDVRLLGPDDGDVLARAAPDVFDNALDPIWSAEFLGDPRHHIAVAIDDGVVVAMATGVHYVHPDKGPQLFVNEVAVASTHQGRRLGRAVLDALLALRAPLGCSEAWVLTDASNTVARRLYAGTRDATAPERCLMYTFPETWREEDASPDGVLDLVAGRRGHFRLESGHHGALWLDLDALFADPQRVAPLVSALADAIRPHRVDVVCGPLVGGAFLAQLVAQELGVGFAFTERTMDGDDGALYRARYRMPPSVAARVHARRVAIVDDVMSAGSALRGTHAELTAHGADVVVAGALLVLGTAGTSFFAGHGIEVASLAREAYDLWTPQECPLCAAGAPLEDVVAAAR